MNTIVYKVENSLYINITNKCTNNCEFCIRRLGEGAYGSEPLWLDSEPTVDEIVEAVKASCPDSYDELIYCGYGEPTMRLDALIESARQIKKITNTPIRINTNGMSDLVNGEGSAARLKGVVDTVSVSLNAARKEDYNAVCHPVYENGYEAMLKFTADCTKYVDKVIMSVVRGTIPDSDLELCGEIAAAAGAKLRIRELID